MANIRHIRHNLTATGQFNFEEEERDYSQNEVAWPEDSNVIDSPVSGSVWKTEVSVGQFVNSGDTLMILESMKMEIPVYSTETGTVSHAPVKSGQRVDAGQALVVIESVNR